jgi:hypothetical protein
MYKQVRDKRNFGYGRRADYAGAKAIKRHIKKQRGTNETYIARWYAFCAILYTVTGLIDTAKIDLVVYKQCAFAVRKKIETGEISVSYGVNLISTANKVMQLLRHDYNIWLAPAEHIGRRCRIRKAAPQGMEMANIHSLAQDLIGQGKIRFAVIILLCRILGLRKREACLLDCRAAVMQAKKFGRVRVTKGSKGGYCRRMQRWVPVDEELLQIIELAAKVQGSHTSLVPPAKKLKQFMQAIDRAWGAIRTAYGYQKIHDLRACYACERYFQLTGFPAPVLNDNTLATPTGIDQAARKIISRELGHNRIDIIGAYVGGRK